MNDVPMPTIELTEDQKNNLIFAAISDNYEEYAMRCAVAGMKPLVSRLAFDEMAPRTAVGTHGENPRLEMPDEARD